VDAAPKGMTMLMIDRRAMRFAETVEEAFSFLELHGFKRIKSEPTFVRFATQRIRLDVYHGRQSFEVGLEIASLEAGSDDKSYSMSEIIRLVEPSKADEYRNYAAQSAAEVGEGVRRLAARVRRYVDAGVLDNPRFFRLLQENREKWAQNYAREVNLTQVRRQLEIAWHAKDYPKVVTLLHPLRATLTPTELQKLEYAEKHTR
jgi:hypothetical protein